MKTTLYFGTLFCAGLTSVATVSTSSADESTGNNQSIVKVDAGVSFTEQYTDNVFLTSNDRHSDFVTKVSPWARLSLDRNDFKLTAKASAQISRYRDNSSENFEDYSIDTDARYRVRDDLFVFGGLDYAWDHEDRSSPDDVNGLEPTSVREASGYFGIGGTYNEKSYRFGVNIRDLDFDDTPASGGVLINNDDRDRHMIEIGGRAGVAKIANGEVFVQGIYNQRKYDTSSDDFGFQRDSQGIKAEVGFKGRKGNLSGEVLVGVMSQDYDDTRFGSVTTPTVGADLTWRTGPASIVNFEIERTIEETTISAASSYVSTSAGARIRHRIAKNMSLVGYYYLTSNDYEGIERSDTLTETGVSLRYHINPRFFLNADYGFQQRLSDVAGAEFDEHRIYLGFGTGLRPSYKENVGKMASFDSKEFYVGAQFGDSVLQTKVDGPRGGGGNLTAEFGDRGAVGGAFAGYRVTFNKLVLGVEANADFGNAEWSHIANRTFSVKKSDSFGLSGITGYRTASGNLIYGRVGVSLAKFESRYQKDANQVALNDREVGFNVGVGAEFPIGHGLSGRMEYQIRAYDDYQVGAPLGGTDDDNFANLEAVAHLGLLYKLGTKNEVVVEPVDFGGFYAGVQLGHGSLQGENTGPRTTTPLNAVRSGQGFTSGVLAGYGYQTGPFYIGIEAELEMSKIGWDIERSPVGRIYSVEKMGTIGAALRAGYVVNKSVLVYGRAGLVRSKFSNDYQFSGVTVGQNDYLTGFRFGGGVELSISPKLNMQLDYTYTNYDSHQVNYGSGIDQFDTNESLFRIGLKYQL